MRQVGSCSSDKAFRNKRFSDAGSLTRVPAELLAQMPGRMQKAAAGDVFCHSFSQAQINRRLGLVPAFCKVLEALWGAEVDLGILSWKSPRFHGVQGLQKFLGEVPG